LGTDVPAIFHSAAGVTATSAAIAFVSFRPCVNSPNENDCFVAAWVTRPSATVKVARSAWAFSAAKSSSSSRAAAATRRSCGAIRGVVPLPKVPASNGTRSVSAITSRTASTGERSSSATTWLSDVRMFCPISTLPV
jgi:hypothetical protein